MNVMDFTMGGTHRDIWMYVTRRSHSIICRVVTENGLTDIRFHYITLRCFSHTLHLNVWWNEGPGLPLMYLYNEWCNHILVNRIRILWEQRRLYVQ